MARVLVIDDEPYIGRSVRLVLGQHEVTSLTQGRAAIDLIVSGARFDVIFCDLMMPEMTGMELYDELARVAPECLESVVFLTGGAFTPAAEAFLARVSNLRIDKPFDPAMLREIARARAPKS